MKTLLCILFAICPARAEQSFPGIKITPVGMTAGQISMQNGNNVFKVAYQEATINAASAGQAFIVTGATATDGRIVLRPGGVFNKNAVEIDAPMGSVQPVLVLRDDTFGPGTGNANGISIVNGAGTQMLAINTSGGVANFAGLPTFLFTANSSSPAVSIVNGGAGIGLSVGGIVDANLDMDSITRFAFIQGQVAQTESVLFYNGLFSGNNTTTIQQDPTPTHSVTYTLPPDAPASTGYVLSSTTGGIMSWIAASGSGTVTSVGQTFTGGLISVSGSPVTASGTLALTVAGTSGGVPYFSSASTWASSAALTAHGVVIGGGPGTAPTSTAVGTAGQCLTSNGAGVDPTFQPCGSGGAGANTSLSNLSAVAINTALLPASSNSIDAGGSSLYFKDVYGYTFHVHDKVLPDTDSTRDVGAISNAFNTVFAQNFYGLDVHLGTTTAFTSTWSLDNTIDILGNHMNVKDIGGNTLMSFVRNGIGANFIQLYSTISPQSTLDLGASSARFGGFYGTTVDTTNLTVGSMAGSGTRCVQVSNAGVVSVASAGCGTGSGTVTSISTTGPISGGTITTSGTISCPTCLTTSTGANVNLSNLASPTAINQNLLPDMASTRDIGATSNAFNTVFAQHHYGLDFHLGTTTAFSSTWSLDNTIDILGNHLNVKDIGGVTLISFVRNGIGANFIQLSATISPQSAVDMGASGSRFGTMYMTGMNTSSTCTVGAASCFTTAGGQSVSGTSTFSTISLSALTGTFNMTGTQTVSGGSLIINSTSNFYNRNVADSVSPVLSCSGVADGWTAVIHDGTNVYFAVCYANNRYKATLTAY